jgi:hypothetical protein
LNLISISTEYNNQTKTKQSSFDQAFFTVDNFESENTEKKEVVSKGHIKRQDPVYKGHVENTVPIHNKADTVVRNKIEKIPSQTKQSPDLYEVKTPSDMRKTNRRNLILNTIKKKGGVMIKDLVPIVRGCSEKTIQRELALLISSGVIKKEGERRWSIYKMA